MALTGERHERSRYCSVISEASRRSRSVFPEQVVAVLSEFYTLMIDTVFKHEGTLDKFLGDAVMAVFGAPIHHQDHSIRAIRTAVAMQLGIEELSKKRMQEGKDPIAIGIGVSAGEAVAGTVGTENRMEYTVIGDRVNLAARLEANAKPGQILISQWTYEKVEKLVNARSVRILQGQRQRGRSGGLRSVGVDRLGRNLMQNYLVRLIPLALIGWLFSACATTQPPGSEQEAAKQETFESDDFIVAIAKPGDSAESLAGKFLGDSGKAWMIEEYNGTAALSRAAGYHSQALLELIRGRSFRLPVGTYTRLP